MNIVLTFDDSYVQHASVLIASVCSNNDGLINFFIISDYISEQNVKHINELVYAYKNSVTFIMLDKHSLEKFPIGEGTANTYVSLATYYRLLIPDLIPVEINKVIYLDCDIVVMVTYLICGTMMFLKFVWQHWKNNLHYVFLGVRD